MPFDLAGALKEGYSYSEIADHLSQGRNFDTAGARKEGYTDEEIARHLTSTPSTERTFGEAIADPLLGVVKSGAKVLQIPGQLQRLITGTGAPDEGLEGYGKRSEDIATSMQSEGLKAREAQRGAKLAEAEKLGGVEGLLKTLGIAAWETLKDPALVTTLLAEQVSQFALTGGVGKAAQAANAVRMTLAKATAEEIAKSSLRVGVSANIATGALMQGVDVGADTYEEIYNYEISQGRSKEAARDAALNKARAAAVAAAAISVGAQNLPGARKAEEYLLGGGQKTASRLGALRVGAVTGAQESLSEGVEEGGGAVAKNVAVQQADPTRTLMQGVGTATGLGMVGGLGVGAPIGAISSMGGAATQAPPPPPAQPGQEQRQQVAKVLTQELQNGTPVDTIIEGLALGFQEQGLSRKDALAIATAEVSAAAGNIDVETAPPKADRAAEIADELISYGVDPATAQKDAAVKAAEEASNDAAAAAQEKVNAQQTAPPVAPPVAPTITPVPGTDQSSDGVPILPATPAGQTTATGTAPLGGTESTTASPAGGAQAQSAALKTKPNNFVQDNARAFTEAIRKQNPALLDQVTALHAQDLTAGDIASKLNISTDQVRELRIGLELPSQGKPSGGATMQIPGDAEERTKFEAWRNNYNQQNASIATQVKPAAVNFALKEVLPADSPTGKKQWQVMNSAGELLSAHDKKTDADTAIKQVRAEARKVVGQAPVGRKPKLTPEQRAANLQATRANTNNVRKTQTTVKKDVTQVAKALDQKFDEGKSKDDADNVERKKDFDAQRVAAIVQAMQVVASKKMEGTEAKSAAEKVLTNESITPAERFKAENQVRIAAGLKPILNPISRSERTTSTGEVLTESTNTENNSNYLKFETATQALISISKDAKSTRFEKFVADRIAPFVRDVRIVVVNKNTVVPPAVQAEFDSNAAGVYYKRVIYLDSKHGINNVVFLHEALHAALNNRLLRFFKASKNGLPISKEFSEQVDRLQTIMDSARKEYNTLDKFGLIDVRLHGPKTGGAFDNIFEFIAYGMSNPAMQDFLLQAEGTYSAKAVKESGNLFTRFVAAIRDFFGMGPQHQSAMQDLIIITDQLLTQPTGGRARAIEAAPSAAKKNRVKVDQDMEKIKVSNSSAEVVGTLEDSNAGRDFSQDFKDDLEARMGAMNNGTLSKILGTMQTSDILRWKGDEIPGLTTIDSLSQDLANTRGNMLAKSSVLAKQLAAFVRKNGQKVLGNTMHLARLKSVPVLSYSDRTDALANDKLVKHYEKKLTDTGLTPQVVGTYKASLNSRRADINAVFDQWDALGKQKDGHKVYEMVRKFYLDNYNLTRATLNKQIAELPIDDAAKAKLMKSVRLMQEDVEVDESDKGEPSDTQKIKQSLREYFPFSRYGEYWLRVAKGPAGPETHFFESGKDRNKFLTRRARELNLDKEDSSVFSVGDDIAALRKTFGTESLMLQKMFTAIDESKLSSAEERDALKDQLYQTYLMTLPERSIRKQFLHAQEKAGFSSDIFRNFQTYAHRFSNQIPKLIYGDKIRNAISASRDNIKDQPTTQRGRNELFLNVVARRAEDVLNPPEDNKLVTFSTQFAFLWLLTSPASAATQMASIPIMVMPTLNAEYGYGAAAAKAFKYLSIWKSMGTTERNANGEVTFTAPSIGNSQMVTSSPIMQRAFKEGQERNIFLTNTSVLTNTLESPDSSKITTPSYAIQTTYNVMTALFNGAERISREATYMMTFELEYAKTKNFDASVAKAADTTHELLFRYDNMNRPDILKGSIGRTILQFKMYAVGMTSFFMRNAYNALRVSGISMDERIKALHVLSGTLAMGGVFHGLVGMPLYSTICMAIDAAMSAFGDDEEKKRRIRKNPLTASDSNMRFRYEYLPENFGTITLPGLDMRQHRLSEILEKGALSALTDINVGSRTSFDNMWWRAPQPGKNWMESAQNIILANLGPGVSTGVNMIGAIDDFNSGRIVRGLEKTVPAFFRGSLTAYRIGTEGAESKRGDDMLKPSEISDANLVAQVLGFPPSRLARIQEQNFATKQELMDAQNKHNKLLTRMNDVIYDPEGNKSGLKEVIEDIKKFNHRYPIEGLLISSDTIQRSLEAYMQKTRTTIRGQVMPPKFVPFMKRLSDATAPLS